MQDVCEKPIAKFVLVVSKNGTITEISSNPGLGHLGATPPHSACECSLESGKLFYSLSILFLSLLIPCLGGVY